jgi:hypothetical protein
LTSALNSRVLQIGIMVRLLRAPFELCGTNPEGRLLLEDRLFKVVEGLTETFFEICILGIAIDHMGWEPFPHAGPGP